MKAINRLVSRTFWNRDLPHLLRHEGFRAAPWRIVYRTFLWGIYGFLHISPTFRLTKNGPWLHVESNQRHTGAGSAFVFRDWAEPELRYLHLLIGPGDVFVDCGANIGIYSTKAAHLVGENGFVVAVEPGKDSLGRLQGNMELNSFRHVRVISKALADKEGVSRLYHTGDGTVNFSLMGSGAVNNSEEVEVTTLDNVLSGFGISRLDCLKIDVEGAEPLVIRGAQDSIRRYRPKIIFEINSTGTLRSGHSATEAWDSLKEMGYSFYILRGGEFQPVESFPTTGCNVVAMATHL